MLAQWFLGMSKSSSKDTKKLHLVSYATFITFFSLLPNTRTILQHAEFDRVVEISFAYKSCGSVLTINLSSFYCAFENRIWWCRRRLGGADNFLHISLQLSNNGPRHHDSWKILETWTEVLTSISQVIKSRFFDH